MRRLPIYFLIDVSESMIGEPIEQVQEGIATIIKELKTDPYALETVWVSIIGFAGMSHTITPLQDVITFYPPKIPIGSGTSLSSGLKELMKAIDADIIKTTFEVKGDWKPIIFLFTDGVPTDDTQQEMNRWITKYKSKTNLISVSIGDNTNYALLGKLTEQVLQFNNTDANSYKEFFKWVTASIRATSEQVNNSNIDGINLNKANSQLIEKIDLTKEHRIPDDQYVVINGKCSSTHKLYLLKFRRELIDSGIMDLKSKHYRIEGAYKVDGDAYKKFSNENNQHLKISANELFGNPPCPSCGNSYALATCSCGGIHCISGDGENKCPWCGNNGYYGMSDGEFDINRTLG